MQSSYFGRNTTSMIKGIALIFMFIHHLFTFPSWYIEGISYPELESFAMNFQYGFRICVPIFAFLSGYFYCSHKDKSFRYSFKKITDLLISYWFVYIVLLMIALATNAYQPTLQNLIFEWLAIDRPIMLFCWYVPFYCAFMLVLPLLFRLLDQGKFVAFFGGITFPPLVCEVLKRECESRLLLNIINDFEPFFQFVVIGYICARYSLFSTLFDPLFKHPIRNPAVKWLVWSVLLLVCFIGRIRSSWVVLGKVGYLDEVLSIGFSTDIFFVPVFVYALANIVQRIPLKPIRAVLVRLGQKSLLMWFFHCLFFSVNRDIFQPILYLPKHPVLVVCWGLLLSYFAAALLDIPIQFVTKWKNRFLFQEKKQPSADGIKIVLH